MTKYTKWFTVFAIFNILDCLTTAFALKTGVFVEANPLMRFVIHQSMWLFIFLKFAIIPVLHPAVRQADLGQKGAQRSIKVLAVFYGLVVLSNSIQLLMFGLHHRLLQNMV